jgi:hypothetical protein
MAIQGECMKSTYDLKPYFNRCSVSWYQDNCRIFMDEYEVEEIDNLEFRKRKNLYLAKLIGEPYINNFPCPSIINKIIEQFDENYFDTSLLMKRFLVKE